jgi:Mce-associated membrane protein
MSTTRHLVNRRRRLAAAAPARTARPPRAAGSQDPGWRGSPEPEADLKPEPQPQPEPTEAVSAEPVPRRPWLPVLPALPALLALLTVLLGGFAGWAATEASRAEDSSASRNTALTDAAATSEVRGTVAQAVNAVFSYTYADPARTDEAARRVLVGKAVQQYEAMLAEVRKQGPRQKLVLTTTVTDSGVEMMDGRRARVLIFADQRNTSTASGTGTAGTTYAAAMLAVDAVHRDGTWKITGLDTFS